MAEVRIDLKGGTNEIIGGSVGRFPSIGVNENWLEGLDKIIKFNHPQFDNKPIEEIAFILIKLLVLFSFKEKKISTMQACLYSVLWNRFGCNNKFREEEGEILFDRFCNEVLRRKCKSNEYISLLGKLSRIRCIDWDDGGIVLLEDLTYSVNR